MQTQLSNQHSFFNNFFLLVFECGQNHRTYNPNQVSALIQSPNRHLTR